MPVNKVAKDEKSAIYMSVQARSLLTESPATVTIRPELLSIATTGLDLVLPCCNPPEGWEKLLIAQYYELKALMGPVPVQLILVDDGSVRQVGALQLARLETAIPGIIIISYRQNRGKGHAVREGVKRARYGYQVCTDLDFPFGAGAVKAAFDRLQQGADVVAGERGQAYLQLLPHGRRMITRANRLMNRLVLQLKVCDAQAGLKGFNRKGREVLLATRIDGFLYDSEFIYKAGKKGQLYIDALSINCRPGICFSSFKTKLLIRELKNYLRIIFASAHRL